IHRRDDGVLYAQLSHGFGYSYGLVWIRGQGLSLCHGAERAVTSTRVAKYHKGNRPTAEAFAYVRA
ncbi:MAG: hypothetical protein QW815_01940, partial [Nitrososphaerota archaeon]